MDFYEVLVQSVQFLTSQMMLAVGTKWFNKILKLILCIDFHGLGSLVQFVA
jgi:hypothetical protein